MQASILTDLLLPLSIGIIMFGLGLSLTLDDFRRVARYPLAVGSGLALQVVLLPLGALAIAIALRLSPDHAVGLMLLAAAPGGATANIYSHLARGDVALNITLTAVNSLLCLVTLPIVLDLSLGFFLGTEQYVPPPHRKVIEVGAIILIPVALGMLVRARAERFALRAEKPIKLFAILVLAALIAIAIYMERKALLPSLVAVGSACLAFNLLSMFSGYLAPLALRLPRSQAVAISMEIGIHNAALAIYIALNVLKNPAAAVVPGIYSLVMYVTATLFVLFLLRRQRAAAVARG
ncbi:bile acid:sodium symporter family protein [Bosea sp. (in: a-proteobacteria)]|jgi:BASS family bile acid:Na+ symporter|uniref:bile acid:sodium symporter family protein n=1 Tax=Bosea sp. (in: a-proteobacteria) TaxID=1871050 RepID=UPI00086B5EA8|nr:bile acid:sodium symporter family protein [Bosea sp. (in: a-proteobacteria)]MBN9438623.1 bile acid:sodium symporter family protein [Bosea sp. (in: a-proteobacteria)]MBN9450093.1 bile acid:sodium symporter family protein [Bosea sp. (in: a-proteobacteria)]ODT49344.1 MAG: bile acid:sodium symporter [Methylobacterium sp. SCN 67-24]